MFIWGQYDALIEVNKSKEMAMSIKQDSNFQFKIFDNADHSLYAGSRKPVHLKYMKDWLQKSRNKIESHQTTLFNFTKLIEDFHKSCRSLSYLNHNYCF